MKSTWHGIVAKGLCLGFLAVAGLSVGCVVHAHGPGADVEIVDEQGYHHTGHYDDAHVWHGGYYDNDHNFHNDPPDWHH